MNRWARLALVPVLASPVAACANHHASEPPQQEQLARALGPPARLEPPATLHPVARELLRRRMASHARDMGDLMNAIMVLRYDEVRARAEAIAGDVDLARPLTGDATELSAQLPERFFDLQDELRARAGVLAAAAAAQSVNDVAGAYGKLAETCVSCHAVYRAGVAPK